MAATVDYYLALNSPWSYLGSPRLQEIAARHGASVRVKPVKLGEVFAKTGGTPLPQRPLERRNYRLLELERWSTHLGVPLVVQPRNFPSDETTAAHLVIAAQEDGLDALGLATALGRQLWEEDMSLADMDALRATALLAGVDADQLLGAHPVQDLDAIHTRNTEDALAAGVFGVPSYVVNGEVFWGQDRLDFLDRKLAAS
ncbi:2-hydroxychromene-2-carboxylate isomerase [Caenispirillum salinarum AK4]|uniref:2-hydroxychromene-2-carboxylate isomerase n=1 Tax=Caenispirillum salinarum AK4 TaxID=1238182 RepID=K9GWI2_9PROT|nr:2-hydroxychromene-2-carboxylate isomerase [Caenispirillum salinarum]EKV29602.1 2-hydroxychromene-2-carboxylate isomerase [Caenispirillum salinarum AK4]